MIAVKKKQHQFPTDLVDLLKFIHIILFDRNLLHSKKDKTFDSLKNLFCNSRMKIEQWEIILRKFLDDTPREQGLPWTRIEKEVWVLVLFFTSEEIGSYSPTTNEYYFMLENKERRDQLSPLIRQLGLKKMSGMQ